MTHVFVYVVRSSQDPFWGIKRKIAEEGLGDIVDVMLTKAEFDLVDRVEYSRRKLLRFLFYPKIFHALVQRLEAAIDARASEPVTVWIADEGVWAVLWKDLRTRKQSQIRAVNVQHGFATLEPARFIGARRILNGLSRRFTGFPAFGFGSLAGLGANVFDVYLTYDEATARVAAARGKASAIATPHIIKAELLATVAGLEDMRSASRVLFAMQPYIKGSLIRCGSEETLDELLPLARALKKAGGELVIRWHPGMNAAIESERFDSHSIAEYASIDEEHNIQRSIALSSIVMSFYSTVLWEAQLLGRLAVQVKCRCCGDIELPYGPDRLFLSDDLQGWAAAALARAQTISPSSAVVASEQEWAAIRPLLVK